MTIETAPGNHDALAPLTPEEIEVDKKINAFIRDFVSRFINTGGVQPAADNEKVEFNIGRTRYGDGVGGGTILEALHIAQHGSPYGRGPLLEFGFRISGIGNLSAESRHLPEDLNRHFHVRPNIAFFDEKTQGVLTGLDALDAVSSIFQSGKFRSLPGK